MMDEKNSQNKAVSDDNDLAVIVVSYDGYSDLWDDFFTLLHKFWPDNPYRVYLANNVKKPEFDKVTVINSYEDAQWSTRTRMAVEQVREKYVCLLLEDFFIGSKINSDTIKEIVSLMKSDDLRYYKLNSFSKIKGPRYKAYDHLCSIPESLRYGISLQPAVWERDYLLKLVGPEDYNAWKFEYDRIDERNTKSEGVLAGCVYDKRNVLNICHGVVKGKFLPSAVKYFKSINYNLNTSEREFVPRWKCFLMKLRDTYKPTKF